MAVLQRLKNSARAALASPSNTALLDNLLQLELSRELSRLQNELRAQMPENPAAYGYKVYSQADEDGIIGEIARRMGLECGSFIEIGCGDGRENNTHLLLLKGWRGIWVDGNADNIASIRAVVPTGRRLRVIEQLVTRENVTSITAAAGVPLEHPLDLLSVDIDGNDLEVAKAAIAVWSPKIVVVEYNAKFPYPMQVQIDYDPQHQWLVDDYHGASLGAWVTELAPAYRLVACNLAGTNAFFVTSSLSTLFANYPPERLYQPARFHLTALRGGHVPSLSFLARRLRLPDD